MPEPVARRYRDGEEKISTEHRDVSVIYAQLVGFDDIADAEHRRVGDAVCSTTGRSLRRGGRTARCRTGPQHAGQRPAGHLRSGGPQGGPRQPHHRLRQGADRDPGTLQRSARCAVVHASVSTAVRSPAVWSASVPRSTRCGARPSIWPTGYARRPARRASSSGRPGARLGGRHLPVQ